MKYIKDIEKITNIYPRWKPSDIAFIKGIKWSNNNMVMVLDCQLRDNELGWPNMAKDFFEISLNFVNVSNLKLEFIGFGVQQITGFDILSLSNNEIEHMNFEIEDYENGIIGFYCKEIEVL